MIACQITCNHDTAGQTAELQYHITFVLCSLCVYTVYSVVVQYSLEVLCSYPAILDTFLILSFIVAFVSFEQEAYVFG